MLGPHPHGLEGGASEAELIGAGSPEPIVLHRDAAGPTFSIARRGSRFVVWGRGQGAAEADPGAGRIRVCRSQDPEAWGHQLGTVTVPLLLAERGAAALHAAAFLGPAGAVVLAGGSGSGKSTTATLAAEQGMAPLADDAVVFAGGSDARPLLYAGGSGLWTTPRALAAAQRADRPGLPDGRRSRRIHCPAIDQPRGAVSVAAIVVLGEREAELDVRSLPPAAALPKLVPALLHVGDRPALERSFAALAAVLERTPAWLVAMPAGLDAARDGVGELTELVASSL